MAGELRPISVRGPGLVEALEKDHGPARRALRAGPWAWCPEAEAWEAAPPAPPAGHHSPLLTVRAEDASVWVEAPEGATVLGKAAAQTWQRATDLVSRIIPIQVRARPAPLRQPHLTELASLSTSTGRYTHPVAVNGRSFGLSFCLMHASHMLGVDLPAHGVASACLAEGGELGPVEGVQSKAALVARWLPNVREVWVAEGQQMAWCEVLRPAERGIAVQPFATAADAIEALLVPGVLARLDALAGRPVERAAQVDEWFKVALGIGKQPVAWGPMGRALDHARARWTGCAAAELWRLDMALAIVARHAGTFVTLPDVTRVTELPPETLPVAVAHVLQHHRDGGEPQHPDVERLRAAVGPEVSADLRVRGAWARLLDARGDLQAALDESMSVAEGWLNCQPQEATRPLSLGFRLAGALGAPEAFRRLDDLWAQARRLGCDAEPGRSFIEVPRAAAAARLSLAPTEDPAEVLRAIWGGTADLAPHLRFSAGRELGALLRRAGGDSSEASEIEDRLGRLNETGRGEARDAAAVYLALMGLDEAVRRADEAACGAWVERLTELDRRTVGPVLDCCGDGALERGAHLALHYPY